MRRIWSTIVLIVLTTASALAQGSSIVTAAPIPPTGSADGTITDLSTQQYWKVTVTNNGYLRFLVVSTPSLDVDLVLYDTDGVEQIMTNGESGTTSEVFGFVAPGTFYLRVSRWSGTGSYTVTTSFVSPTRFGDPESNNTPGGAVALTATASSTGHIGHFANRQTDNDDYWRINVTQDGWLRVQVRADSLDARGDRALDLDLTLYDFTGTKSLKTDGRTGTFSQVDYFVGSGTYFVRVYRYAGRAGSYDIKSDFFAPPLASDQETNDTQQSASALPMNGSATGHIGYYNLGTTDNDDFWKFTTTSDGKVVVRVVSDSLDRSGTLFDLELALYDLNGASSITTDTRSGNISECTLYLRPGTYIARIYRWSGNAGSYALTATHTPPNGANDVEGNDWFAAAGTLSFNVTSSGHIGYYAAGATDTQDFWRITATSGDSMYVQVTSDSTIDLDVVAYAPDSSSSLTSDTRSGTISRVGLKPVAGLTYFLRVYRWQGTAGAYTILATRTPPASDVRGDSDDKSTPREWSLEQNYPNPFNPSTTIRYALPETRRVRVSVYSLLGQEITTLVDAIQPPSTYTLTWNGKDRGGKELPSGVYIISLEAGGTQIVRKAMLVR